MNRKEISRYGITTLVILVGLVAVASRAANQVFALGGTTTTTAAASLPRSWKLGQHLRRGVVTVRKQDVVCTAIKTNLLPHIVRAGLHGQEATGSQCCTNLQVINERILEKKRVKELPPLKGENTKPRQSHSENHKKIPLTCATMDADGMACPRALHKRACSFSRSAKGASSRPVPGRMVCEKEGKCELGKTEQLQFPVSP